MQPRGMNNTHPGSPLTSSFSAVDRPSCFKNESGILGVTGSSEGEGGLTTSALLVSILGVSSLSSEAVTEMCGIHRY